MAETCDPYHKWLGIPPKDQPPHNYRLLGIELIDAPRRLVVEFNDYQVTGNLSLSWRSKDLATERAIPVEALFYDPALE